MRILVTGIFGFIGSHFVKHVLEATDDSVVGFGRNTNQRNKQRLEWVENSSRFRLVFGDLTGDISELLEGIDVVVNFAAKSIAEEEYVPIQSVVGTRCMTFSELWTQQSKKNKPRKKGQYEVIKLRGKQTRALSFLNGGQWMPIRSIMRHRFKGKLVKLSQKWGSVTATGNHSVYASNLELSTPEKNPELLVIRQINENKKSYKKVSKSFLRIIAAYVTEGCACFNKANGNYVVVIAQNDRKWLEQIAEDISKRYGLLPYVSKKKQAGVYRLEVNNKTFYRRMIKNCGKGSGQKHLPNFIFDLEPSLREYFWECLCEGDGTKDFKRYGTTSTKLAHQLSLLLAMQKKPFTVRCQKLKKKNWNDIWQFRILSNFHRGLNKKTKEDVDYDGWVYDLEVEGSHNFACGMGNVVCHNTFVDHSIREPKPFISDNLVGTFNLLEQARKFKPKLFIQVSTDEVYGSILEGAHTETSPLAPKNPYSASKAAADLLALSYCNTYGVPIIITRTENNYGEFQHPQKVLPTFVHKAMKNKPLPVYGDGKHRRMWLYVLDHCKAIYFLIGKGKIGEIYHVASSEEMENIELAKRVLKVLGKPDDMIQFIDDSKIRPGHDRRYAIDSSRIRNLGWEQTHTLDNTFEQVVQWYAKNEWWYV